MTRLKWGKISSIVILLYGLFLQLEAWLPAWRPIQLSFGHDIAECVGGIVIVFWAIVFLRLSQ